LDDLKKPKIPFSPNMLAKSSAYPVYKLDIAIQDIESM